MLPVMLEIALSLALLQAPPANAACTALTPAQVSSLIGTAHTLPVAASATGSSCMFQNNDKVITVLIATVSSVEGAQQLFKSKKLIASGADVAGWNVPAYAGIMRPAAVVVGVLVKQTLTEVKIIDASPDPDAVMTKLKAVMKDVAARK